MTVLALMMVALGGVLVHHFLTTPDADQSKQRLDH